ncbi:MAG: CHASE3 domain-containing protein [Armatimonadota bacterium]|nr:CHASE3 domain-containing protein [Armatimonadota bacterium]
MMPLEQVRFGRTLARAVALPLVLILILGTILLFQIFDLLDESRWVDRSDRVIARANLTEKLLLDLETGVRGYLLTGKREFLKPYEEARGPVASNFSELEKSAAYDPVQERRLREIWATAREWNDYAENVIAVRDRGAGYSAYVSGAHGKRLMDFIRTQFVDFIAVEEKLRDERSHTEQVAARRTLLQVALLGIAFGALMAWFIARELIRLSHTYKKALDTAHTEADRAHMERERFEITLRSIGDAVIATDADGQVTFINLVAEFLTGWVSAQAVGRPLEEVFHIISEQTNSPIEHPVARVIREGIVIGLANHTALVSQDGTIFSIEDSAAPIRDDENTILGVVLVFRNITFERQAERERAELMVRERASRKAAERGADQLQFLAEASRVLASSLEYQTTLDEVAHLAVPVLADWCAIEVLDEWGVIRRVAVAHTDPEKVAMAYELDRRYPVDPDSPQGVPNVLRTGEAEIYPEISDEMLVAGTRDEEHLRISRELGLKSALIVPLKARGETLGVITLIYAESGRRYSDGDLALAEDLARRAGAAVDNSRLYTEAQKALRLHEDLESRLTSLTEATSTLVTSLHPDRLLPEILALAEGLVAADAYAIWRVQPGRNQWERPAAEGLSDSFLSVVTEAGGASSMPDRPLVIEDIRTEPLLRSRTAHLEAEGVRSMLVMPLHRQEAVVGTLVFYYRCPHHFDDTELKVARALANIASSAISTVSLYHELQQRADALLEEDRLKDQFLAMLAHELRNPLGAITNAYEVLGTTHLNSDSYQRAHKVVGRQSRHMARLVDQLLDVSRISHGKIELRRESLDMAQLVRATCEDHDQILDAAGVSLRLNLPAEPLWIDGDGTRLRQAVGNLLQNAAKFTPRGGIVTISVEKHRDGSTATVSVQDTGVGIPAELLPRLFEPFMQADHTLDRTKGGLGLGLALVKAIMELHHGTVSAQSAGPRQGSTFVLQLPLHAGPVLEAPVFTPAAGASRCSRVLIIEDNVDAAETLRDVLDLLGHDVEVALSGPEGLEKAQRLLPDVILCDLGLPDMDGFEVARTLRTDPQTASLRLIATSGYGQEEDKRRSREAGFDRHLTKPLDLIQLQEAIEAVSG